MTDLPPDREEALADALEDLHLRRGRGEEVAPDAYRDRLGESHGDFLKIVAAEARLDGTLVPAAAEALPRAFAGFTLLREIGRGASGVVYEAMDRKLGRTVALKVLRTGVDTDASALERFRREAKACAHVRHDHIVAIHEAGETDGRPWYSMDLVPGEALSAKLRAGERMEPKALATGIGEVADGLHALHAAGIVHRDVKPQNLIVRPDGRMILADFGLARSAHAVRLTQTGDALGTPLYMSPEQMLGKPGEVDARTDVYGLGATMYEALCGQPVFRTEDFGALLRMVLTQRPEPPRTHAPGVPADLEGIVMKCLEKRKEDRYDSAAALAMDLRAFVKGRPTVGRPVGPVVRGLRVARRWWIPIAAAAGVAAAGIAWWGLRPATLRFQGLPGVAYEVRLDGVVVGTTPLVVRVKPGEHSWELGHELLVSSSGSGEISPGGDLTPPLVVAAKDENEKGKKLIKDALGASEPRRAMRRRGAGSAVVLFAPRGDVRLEDVAVLAGELGETQGAVRLYRGSELLWEYRPANSHERRLVLPPSVRTRLRVGDELRWGWYPDAQPYEKPPPTETTARIVDRDVSERLALLDRTLAPDARPAWRVEFLHEAGLETAAFLEAYAAARRTPHVPSAWEPLLVALQDAVGDSPSVFARQVQAYADGGAVGEPPTLDWPAK